MNTLVLSSGLGLRLRPITDNTPKPMIEILNLPLVCYSIYPALSFTKTFVFNLSYQASKLQNKIMNIKVKQKKQFIFEGDKPLGITKGILNSKEFLKDDDFFVINADTIFLPDDKDFLIKCLGFHKSHDAIATFVVCNLNSDHLKFEVDSSNNLIGVDKDKGFHFTGFYILNSKIFDYLSHSDELFNCVLGSKKTVKCYVANGLWFETGDSQSLTKARDYLKSSSDPYLKELLNYY